MSNVDPDKPLILVALGGGGWHREAYRILQQFSPEEFQFAYVYGHHSGNHAVADLPMPHPGPRYPMRYLGPTRKHALRWIPNTARFAISFIEAFRLVRRHRPTAVFTLGSATAIPLCAAAKVRRIPCTFIESLTRVDDLSVTGRIVYRLRLADRLYVQWAALTRRYPRAAYAGAVI
jgi:UDP-N-acetylglucosamine:LPS N-acetylglucosamine transferase